MEIRSSRFLLGRMIPCHKQLKSRKRCIRRDFYTFIQLNGISGWWHVYHTTSKLQLYLQANICLNLKKPESVITFISYTEQQNHLLPYLHKLHGQLGLPRAWCTIAGWTQALWKWELQSLSLSSPSYPSSQLLLPSSRKAACFRLSTSAQSSAYSWQPGNTIFWVWRPGEGSTEVMGERWLGNRNENK